MACIKQCRLAFAQRRCRTRRAMVDVRPAMVDVRPAMVDVRPAMLGALRYAGACERLRRKRACASMVLLLCLNYFETAEQ